MGEGRTMGSGNAPFSVVIEDQDVAVTCEAGDTLLSAMLRSGLGIPYECNAGGCGSCKITLLEGDVTEEREDAPGLSPRDRRKGKRLACVCRPQSNCRIAVRCDPVYEAKIAPKRQGIRLLSRAPLANDLWEFRFAASEPAEFLPGQYAKFHLPEVQGPRSYSMSNIANSDGAWEFQIKRTPGGSACGILFDRLEEGAEIVIDAPYSIAHLQEGTDRPTVCIAGGSGLAPMVSILRGLGAKPGGASNAILYYGARTPSDVVADSAFAGIAGFDPETQYRPVVSEPDEVSENDWSGPVGFVHDFVSEDLADSLLDANFYVAGPPPMVDAVRRHLVLDRKISVEQLHYDRFY